MCSRTRACFPHLSVAGNLRYGFKRADRAASIGWDAVIEVLGIAHLLDRRPIASRVASASGSRSAAHCCASPGCS